MTDTLSDPSDTATPTGTIDVISEATGVTVCPGVPLTSSAPFVANWSCTFAPIGTGGVGTRMAMRVNYSGDLKFASNTRSYTAVEAGTAPTTISVTASPTSVALGASTTLQALLTGTPAPTGNVTFLADGTALPGCGRIVVQSVGAQSKCTYTPASVGSHSITVTYSGDTNYAAAGPSAAATVTASGTTTSVTATPTLVSPAAPVPNADPITVSTVVSGSGAVPTGTVAFGATIGSSTSTPCPTAPINGSGMASCTFTPAFAAGTGGNVSITAVYSGDNTYAQSTSGPLTVNVLAVGLPATFKLTTSKSPLSAGSSATLTAVLTGTPRPTGTVTFYDNGAPTLCGNVKITSTGKAVCIYTPTWGTHTLVATYSGNATYAPITQSTGGFANSAKLVVNATGSSTVVVTSSANPSAYGAAVTLTATVTGTVSGAPTGTISFTTSAGTLAAGCAAAGLTATGPTTSAATCVLTPPTSGTGVIIKVNASYSGDPTYAPKAAVTYSQTEAGPLTPAMTLKASANPAASGSPVTFTAALTGTVRPGTVTFTDNGTVVCAAVTITTTGKATCIHTVSGAGIHTIVASYTGDTTYAARQVTLNETVT
jgi:hypothetical protein